MLQSVGGLVLGSLTGTARLSPWQAAALLAELENGLSPKPASGKSRSRRKKKNGVQEAPAVGVPPVDGEAHVDAGAGEGGGDAARADTGEASEGDCRAVDDGHRGVGGVEGLSDVASSIAQAVGEAAAAAPAETREALSQNGEAERASGQEAAGGEQAGGQESVDEVAAAVPAGQRGDGGHPPARPSWEFPPSQVHPAAHLPCLWGSAVLHGTVSPQCREQPPVRNGSWQLLTARK